jgi:hypothetical protein
LSRVGRAGSAVDTDDESLQGVNRFKESFGGRNEECYKSQTLAMFLLSKMIHVARRAAVRRHFGRLRGGTGYPRQETKSLN